MGELAFATVGGGLGSFTFAQHLRIRGVPSADIRVIGECEVPYTRLRSRLDASQVGPQGRMRSDSAARVDNPWGWPGYAMGEARRHRTPGPILRAAVEPVLAEYFTPTAGQVYDGLDREAARIGWSAMFQAGRVSVVERHPRGGYLLSGGAGFPISIRVRNLHVALGYSANRFDPGAVEFRALHPSCDRVVHAFEDHEHLYERLAAMGGRVLLHGAGITATQELVRMIGESRRAAVPIEVLHVAGDRDAHAPAGAPSRPRRTGAFSFQNFVFPRGANGGQWAREIESSDDDRRAELVSYLGTPTSPPRRAWIGMVDTAQRAGWYRFEPGSVDSFALSDDGRIQAGLRSSDGSFRQVVVDAVIEATGVDASVAADPLLGSMVAAGVGVVNPMGRLSVDECFAADRNPAGGTLYASGPITLGGPVAPVDSFWGLQEAAFRIAEDLERQGALRSLGPVASIAQWWRWLRGMAP